MDAWWVLYRRAPPELAMFCGIFVSVGKPGNASPSMTLLYYPLCWQCSSRFVRSSHFQVPMWLLLAFPNFSKMIFTSHMFFASDSPTLAWSTDVPQTAWDTRSHHERFVSVTIIRVQLLEVLPTGVLRFTIACERHVSTLSTHKEDQRGIEENHYINEKQHILGPGWNIFRLGPLSRSGERSYQRAHSRATNIRHGCGWFSKAWFWGPFQV